MKLLYINRSEPGILIFKMGQAITILKPMLIYKFFFISCKTWKVLYKDLKYISLLTILVWTNTVRVYSENHSIVSSFWILLPTTLILLVILSMQCRTATNWVGGSEMGISETKTVLKTNAQKLYKLNTISMQESG